MIINKVVCVCMLSAVLFGCGGDHETNAPGVKLSASTVASATTDSHVHSVTVSFSDVASVPPADIIQYRSDAVNGHSHVIAFSKQQMIDLNNGMQMTLTSSAPSSGIAHTHVWNFKGGDVLYEKYCYNCHSNDKRNNNPMNVSFNVTQSNAVRNPASAGISNDLGAIPDPNFNPSITPLPVNAASVFAAKCSGCHTLGNVPSGFAPNLSGKGLLVGIKFPTPGVVTHNGQSLTSAEITALSMYFNTN
jgi:mono/diheme cytochrome c family protein